MVCTTDFDKPGEYLPLELSHYALRIRIEMLHGFSGVQVQGEQSPQQVVWYRCEAVTLKSEDREVYHAENIWSMWR